MTTKSLVGQTFGKYRIVEPLGRGGMAEVYKAYQENLDRYVAIKVMHAFLADEEDFMARFQREAKAMASLNHNNIVSVYDFDVQDGMSYIVMEFVSGGTLKNRLEELSRSGSRMPLTESTQLVMEVAGALAYAHAQGMVHRDIKPGNIMLSETGHAVLTDFGIAKILSGPTVTATGAMIGTPAYMSPEQGLGQPGDERSDLYALGVLYYQMTTGRLPYDADTPLAVILKHVNEPIPQPTEFNESCPDEIQAVVVKAMAKDPKERYQSAKDMMVDLRDAASSSNLEIASAAVFAAVRDRPTPVPEAKAEATRVSPPEATVVAPLREATPPPAGATRVASPGAISETEIAGPGPAAAPPTIVAPPKEVEPEKKKSRLWIVGLVLLLLVLAAGVGGVFIVFAGRGSATPTPEEAIVAVLPTDTVEPTATPEEEEIVPTADNVSTAVALIAATLTAQPTATTEPTSTAKPTVTSTPDATATFLAGCEEDVELVNSYTFQNQNNSSSPTGIDFTMNWVIRNSGTCPLPSGLDLVFDSGHEFEGTGPVKMDQALDPGDETTLSTTLSAPDSPGRYDSSWQLLDEDGNLIGSALDFEILVYVPQTPTPRATNTPVATPTPSEPFRFDASAGNCVYDDADWKCDLYVNVYGGIGPYTVLISDKVPPSQYKGAGPFTHTILSRRCNPWVNKITVRDSAGQELSTDRYFDPNQLFQGGCLAPPFEG